MNTKIEYIKIENLILDSNNPRLPSYLHGVDENQIIDYMVLDAATIELMQAIGENDFFSGEQLLVVEVENKKYKVIEGNRRLTSVKLLNDPDLASVQTKKIKTVVDNAKFKPLEIPCLVFDDETQIHRYLGYRHITGIQPWNLRQKARYLYSMKEKNFSDKPLDQACRELAKMIGSRRDYVKRILVGFMIYNEIKDNSFFKITNLKEDTFYFGYIADSLSHINIVEFLGVDLNCDDPLGKINLGNLSKWTKWLFEKNNENQTRLKGKSGDLSKLNKILATPTALDAFEKQSYSLEDAYKLTENIDEIFINSIRKALTELERADGLIHKVSKFENSLEEDLIAIRKLTKKIKTTKDEFENPEFDDDDEF